MSEMTPCNYCTLMSIKQRVKKGDKVITRASLGSMGGVDVFVVPKGETLPPSREMTLPDEKHPNGCEQFKKYHKAWFMSLTDFCAC